MEEDVAVAVDRDSFMESFFRKVGVTATPRMCTGLGTWTFQDTGMCHRLIDLLVDLL